MTFTRSTLAASLLAALAACGGGEYEVRPGPQAVHPSPFPLAQTQLTDTTYTTCAHGKTCRTHTHHVRSADGSIPIVD